MNDREALISGIVAAPDDDAPKLVYADWLDDYGETASAKAIRDIIGQGIGFFVRTNVARKAIRGLLSSGIPRAIALTMVGLDAEWPPQILLLAYADCLHEDAEEYLGSHKATAIRQYCGIGQGLSDWYVNASLESAGLKCRLPKRDVYHTSLGPVGVTAEELIRMSPENPPIRPRQRFA